MAVYPQTDFSDPSWGTLKLPECWIEFSLGANAQVTSFAMHVRGGEHAPEIVARILDALEVRAIAGPIDLEPGSDHLEIRYSALSFIAPSR